MYFFIFASCEPLNLLNCHMTAPQRVVMCQGGIQLNVSEDVVMILQNVVVAAPRL